MGEFENWALRWDMHANDLIVDWRQTHRCPIEDRDYLTAEPTEAPLGPPLAAPID